MPAMDVKKLQSFDWRSLQKYTSPQASSDLNKFLEKMPGNVGQTILIAAGVIWVCAGAMGLYTTVQLQKLTELRAKLEDASSLKPMVPKITDVEIDAAEVQKFAESAKEIYKGLEITANGSQIVVSAKSTADFGQWREAIGHIQNGGSGWRVNIENLCVGRECERNPLAAALKINKVSVTNPADG
jgi:uncharacterized membrane protein YheB (UPF0754 family)